MTEGRDIASTINNLLNLPWGLRIATQDWHPQDHVSFASNHAHPSRQIGSTLKISNPLNPEEINEIRLWPDHCVQDSLGAELVPELDKSLIDHVVRKGQDKRIEMFSAFRDSYLKPSVMQSNLHVLLKDSDITHVYVVGLAADFCVKETAVHAAQDGFRTFIISDGTRAVDQSEEGLKTLKEYLSAHQVRWENADKILLSKTELEEP